MLDVSVIVCTHNPRPDYFRRTLDALRDQDLAMGRWELIVVDNASDAPLARDWDLTWHPNGQHVHEVNLGLAFARRRGIAASHAKILVFVDDDNVLAPNYLSTALQIGNEWPKLGVWGSGATAPEFERPLHEYATPFLDYLGTYGRQTTEARWGNVISYAVTPWGAGLCIRRGIAEQYDQQCDRGPISITGRRGTTLSSHEDFEMSYVACQMRFGMGVFPELKLTHLIPERRLSPEYLLRIFEGTKQSHHLLTYKWTGAVPPNPLRLRGLLSIAKNLATRKGIFERRIFIREICATLNARRVILSHDKHRRDLASGIRM